MGADNGYITAHEFLVCVASDAFLKKQAAALLAQGNGQKTVRFTSKLSNDGQQLDGSYREEGIRPPVRCPLSDGPLICLWFEGLCSDCWLIVRFPEL